MSKKIGNKTLRKTALALALGACFSGGVQAQSNASGAIAGQAVVGDTVVVDNPGTGFHREVGVGSDGSYRLSAVPTGTYTVVVKHADGTSGQPRTVTVNIGGTAQATELNSVTVRGSGAINQIDVASVESTTILTAEQIAKIPVPRNITAVALLAPGTVSGDAVFGNLASFGGSSVAENAFFVNGFNITNAFNNLNFAQIPFEAIAEQQIKTGGYGAEFGRSTGGVINLVTKRGTNDFHAGGNLFIDPSFLRENDPNVYGPGGFNAATGNVDPSLLGIDNGSDDGGNITVGSVWASGALVHDRLYAYALLQYGRTTGVDSYGGINSATNTASSSKSPTWVVKLDWNISQNHLLEFSAFSDESKLETQVFRVAPGTNGIGRQSFLGTTFNKSGGKSYALKYTGYLTDNFTLSALYGHGESSRSNYGITAGGVLQEYEGNVGGPVAGCPTIVDARIGVSSGTVARINGCGFIGLLGSPKAKDQRDQFRVDAEWTLGDHLLRFGVDTDQFKSYSGQSFEGGIQWRYSGNPSIPSSLLVRKRVFQTGAGVEVDSRAYYVEDRWQVTDNFLAYAGLRWDSFKNKNGQGGTFVEIKNQLGPRLGFSWDVGGDQKFKVFGNAGRYALPMTATVAVRGASASLFSEERFTYTGVDPVTGAPIGLTPSQNFCGGPGYTGLCYLNNEFGLGKDPRTIADQNLKPMYQDEYILGFQTQLTEHLSGGVRTIYRDLKAAIDDQCDFRAIYAWAVDNGYAGRVQPQNTGFAYCHLYNPGSDATFMIDIDADGTLETVHLDADVLGPKAKRTYKAVEFFAEGNWDKFFLQGSYTWAKSFGNTEGGVKSDIGQADTGTTQDFDYPELMLGSTGYLPNDRRHSFKLFGNYEINDEWSIGANLLVQSGRPINCLGVYANDPVGAGNTYFSCDTGAPTANNPNARRNNGSTIIPRGSAGRTPWSRTLDMNVAYRPAWADSHLTLKVDVFNLFNEHAVTSVNEAGEDGVGNPVLTTTYKTPTGFQAPRSFRLMVQYDF